jgi:hypothetical protein
MTADRPCFIATERVIPLILGGAMFATFLSFALSWSTIGPLVGPSLVTPGMTYSQVANLITEPPIIIWRTKENEIRVVEYPKARVKVRFKAGHVIKISPE